MDDAQQLANAVRTLIAAGAVFSLPAQKHFSLGTAADQLDCSPKWLREHLPEFPNAWRMPGGELRLPAGDVAAVDRRRQLGELRIPARDVDALATRGRLTRVKEVA